MNRIILIGNGFDIAHNLKTKYSNFIDNYWEDCFNEMIEKVEQRYENEDFFIAKVPKNIKNIYEENNLSQCLQIFSNSLTFKNSFLKILSEKRYDLSWVDIENEYYSHLKESFKGKNDHIIRLNSNLSIIQKALESYLRKIEDEFMNSNKTPELSTIISEIHSHIYSELDMKDMSEQYLNQRVEIEYQNIIKDVKALEDDQIDSNEITDENRRRLALYLRNVHDKQKKIRELLQQRTASNYFNLVPSNILFLNFNYTSLEKLYLNQGYMFGDERPIPTSVNHIHGCLDKSKNNNVIFGFGDEIDEDYKAIENLNDNNYLEKIKSIKYLENDNYKNLLEFINSETYQIFVFGHSCGLSDRTLLNVLFENKNCASIKFYYHKKSKTEDNFADIIKNISRNFSNKTIMRDKVVNKKFCKPLCS